VAPLPGDDIRASGNLVCMYFSSGPGDFPQATTPSKISADVAFSFA
jgi:hypothetical protein